MLAAAHVLAMDAKNLLDVVDSIRERHPNVDWRAALRQCEEEFTQNQVISPQTHTPSPQMSSTQSFEETSLPRPDFKINQPVTTGQVCVNTPPKEHCSLPATSNRVSTLIHNYNVYGNVREPQHIYGNSEVGSSMQHSASDEIKVDVAPMESVKRRIQAISGKIESPPIYAVTKKVACDPNVTHNDQG